MTAGSESRRHWHDRRTPARPRGWQVIWCRSSRLGRHLLQPGLLLGARLDGWRDCRSSEQCAVQESLRQGGRLCQFLDERTKGTIRRVCQGASHPALRGAPLAETLAGGSLREVPARGRYSIGNAASRGSPSTDAHPAFSGCETTSQSPMFASTSPASPILTTAPLPRRVAARRPLLPAA
jgi:hypothetical protein